MDIVTTRVFVIVDNVYAFQDILAMNASVIFHYLFLIQEKFYLLNFIQFKISSFSKTSLFCLSWHSSKKISLNKAVLGNYIFIDKTCPGDTEECNKQGNCDIFNGACICDFGYFGDSCQCKNLS